MLPTFLTYVLSFIFLGIYWTNHHHMLHVTERINVSFRVQFYNITNTPHFGQPNGSIGNYGINSGALVFNPNAQFGEITSVLPNSNREGELGLRITF